MTVLTHDFQFEDALVKLKYANERLDNFNRALIIRKLSDIYGDVGVEISAIQELSRTYNSNTNGSAEENLKADIEQMEILTAAKIALDPRFESAFTIFKDVKEFADIAIRVAELHSDNFKKWIEASDSPAKIDQAFHHFLSNQRLWDAIENERQAMDRPNGVAGAVPEQLSEAEQADPLFVTHAVNGKETS